MRVEIGKMCEKGRGHLSFIGERDHGVCGSHYYATVYIELDRETSRSAEFEEHAAEAGLELAKRLNDAEDMYYRMEALEK